MLQRIIILLWTLALSPHGVSAQTFWESAPGPYGGTIVPALVTLGDGSVLAASKAGVFHSVDGGKTWVDMSDGLTIRDVRALYVEDLGSVLAGTFGAGIFRFRPGTDRWEQTGLSASFVTAIGETEGGVLIAGTTGAMIVSGDQGESWQERPVLGVESLASNASHAFAATGEGVYRSADEGQTWSLESSGMQEIDVLSVAVNAEGHVFAGLNPKTGGCAIYRSRGNGNIWTCIQPATDPVLVPAITFDGSGRLYAGGYRMVFVSDDEGDHWTGHSTDGSSIRSLLMTDTVKLAGTFGSGILRSEDGGRTWGLSNTGVLSTVHHLFADSDGALYAGTDGGVFESTDRGSSWTRVGGGDALVLPVTALARDAANRLVAGTAAGAWRYNDSSGWEEIGPPGKPAIRELALAADGRLFAAYFRGVYILSGQTWTELPVIGFDLQLRDVATIIFTPDGTLLAGSAWDSYRLSPGSPNWELMQTANTLFFSATSFGVLSNGDVLAGSRFQGVLKSEDNAMTWSTLGSGLLGNEDVQAIAYDQVDNVFIGTYGSGVYWMNQFTQVWSPINSGLENHHRVLSLIFDEKGNAFAGTQSGGLFRNASGGSVDVAISPDLPSRLTLQGSFPNPFRSQTTIQFDLSESSNVVVQLFDVTGRKISEHDMGQFAAGTGRRLELRPGNLARGVYFFRLTAFTTRGTTSESGIIIKE